MELSGQVDGLMDEFLKETVDIFLVDAWYTFIGISNISISSWFTNQFPEIYLGINQILLSNSAGNLADSSHTYPGTSQYHSTTLWWF